MQQQIRLLFKLFNYVNLIFASDNADALFHYRNAQVNREYFDVIFLDREVLTLTHRDLSAWIRKEDPTQVIFSFTSAKSQPSNFKELGYDECINKPLDYEALKCVLESWLKLGQERRLNYFRRKRQQINETNNSNKNPKEPIRPYPAK